MYRELTNRRVLVFGCGNVLMGDDGFGPAVVKKLLQRYRLPDDVHAEDVGTSIRDILFNITLLEKRPEHIVLIDAVDKPGHRPGEVFEIQPQDLPEGKIVDYSLHQFPTTNLLKEIQEHCGVRITVVAAQVTGKLDQVGPGLSKQMRAAVREAAEKVMQLVLP